MKTRVSIALDGIPMENLSDRIVVQKVTESAPSWNVGTAGRDGMIGQRYTGTEKRTRDIQVAFAIRERRDLILREQILQKVFSWAALGGWLTISYRAGQRIRVICAAMPAVNGLDAWAESMTITFRAVVCPMWENEFADTLTVGNEDQAAGTLNVRGNANTLLRAEIKNVSGSAVTQLSISSNGKLMVFSSLGLANGETLMVDYDNNGFLRILIKSTGGVFRSAMGKRTQTSADDVILFAGANSIAFNSNGHACDWKFYAHGRWQA